jgi:anti-sigma factor RsiW
VNGHPDPHGIAELEEGKRREALEHLGGCEACRKEAVAGDASRLFALLAARPVPLEILDQVSGGVAAAIRGETSVPRPLPSSRFRTASAWAAAAVLAAALLLPLAGRLGQPGPERAAAAPAGASVPRAGVQLVASPGAIQTVDLTVGETQIVMIFDPRLEL